MVLLFNERTFRMAENLTGNLLDITRMLKEPIYEVIQIIYSSTFSNKNGNKYIVITNSKGEHENTAEICPLLISNITT